MKFNLFYLFLLNSFGFFSTSFSQSVESIIVYDYSSEELDTIVFNSTLDDKVFENTSSFIGSLGQQLQLSDLVPEEQFKTIFKANNLYDLKSYPTRTSVRLSHGEVNLNSYKGWGCSGSLVGNRFVLTSAHCLTESVSKRIISSDIRITPALNNGKPSFEPLVTRAKKAYFFKNWFENGSPFSGFDMALLEIEKHIGNDLGWLGIMYHNDDDFHLNRVFHKFSYPGYTYTDSLGNCKESISSAGSNLKFDGESMYYNLGECRHVNDRFVRTNGFEGAPGQSGSSLFTLYNNEYLITSTLTSFNFVHTKFNRERFEAFQQILEQNFVLNLEETQSINNSNDIIITQNDLTIEFESKYEIMSLECFDLSGRSINLRTKALSPNKKAIYTNEITGGYYFFLIYDVQKISMVKLYVNL